ncbi:hypothetical protein H8E88_04585 [candidate division KSB1 bacterium]|nr:hypothetical protein [candidate division KSB1 bacterium]
MFENKKEQSRREFLKNILRTTVFSGLIGIAFIATKKKDGTSTKTRLCSQQRCGKCSQLAGCSLPAASSFRNSFEQSGQESTNKTGKPK